MNLLKTFAAASAIAGASTGPLGALAGGISGGALAAAGVTGYCISNAARD